MSMATLLRRNLLKISRKEDRFLGKITGLVHVGANTGQEIKKYNDLGLDVIWVEPIPEVFKILTHNIKELHKQRAIQALVTDVDNKIYDFHISNNKGKSSSIFDMEGHKDIWPDIYYTDLLKIKSVTLNSLVHQYQIDTESYQALIIDTQGSELLVLKGATDILQYFRYIKIEVPDFESYTGCCQLPDIAAFMQKHGYSESARKLFAYRDQVGSYYDIIYMRNTWV